MTGGFLLDTNIPSELMRPRPEPKVEAWVAAQDMTALFLSVVSIGELESGFTTMQDAARRARLKTSLERTGWHDRGHGPGAWPHCRYPQHQTLRRPRLGPDKPMA